MKFLSAPWRWKFISSTPGKGKCIFCQALTLPDEEALICYRGKAFFVILNKYPYTSGHLMIAPKAHLDSPIHLPATQLTEAWELINLSLKLLSKKFKPHGFNLGMNIGEAAGAGIKDHFHWHVVPRWQGDANFMATIGKHRVVSYDIKEIFKILHKEYHQ